MTEFKFKNGGYIALNNRKVAQWISILPELAFHIIGARDGKRELFPKKWEGIQIHFTWLWFDICYSSISDEELYDIF